VATDVDGLNEIIENNNTGYLVKVNDDAAMAEKILAVIDDDPKTDDMVKKGRERVSNFFNVKNNIKILEQFYDEHAVKV
jgi:glycosyltransferase involved in cell wall biosynthesis